MPLFMYSFIQGISISSHSVPELQIGNNCWGGYQYTSKWIIILFFKKIYSTFFFLVRISNPRDHDPLPFLSKYWESEHFLNIWIGKDTKRLCSLLGKYWYVCSQPQISLKVIFYVWQPYQIYLFLRLTTPSKHNKNT